MLAERDVEQRPAVRADARPGDVCVLVEELVHASVDDVLREELVHRVPIRHEVQGVAVGAELPEKVVGHPNRQALGAVQVRVVRVLLRARAGDEERRGREREPREARQTAAQHVFSCHLPSAPSIQPAQTTLRRCASRQALRRSSSDVAGFCSCIQCQS